MKVVLPANFIEVLSYLPETGMGYQIVDITMEDGTVFTKTVINSSLVEVNSADEIDTGKIQSVTLHSKR